MRGLTLTVPGLVNPIDLLHIYVPMVMRGLTRTVPSLVSPIDILHIYVDYMPMVMRGLTLTVPGLVNPIDILHIYVPMVMRGVVLTVSSFFTYTYYTFALPRWYVDFRRSQALKLQLANWIYSSSVILRLKFPEWGFIEPSFRDAVFPTFVGIPTFSDLPTFFFLLPPCMYICVTTMRVNWWLSGQFWLRKSSSFKGASPSWTPTRALPLDPAGGSAPRPPVPGYFPTFFNSPSGIPAH